jgi:hypothetical protein
LDSKLEDKQNWISYRVRMGDEALSGTILSGPARTVSCHGRQGCDHRCVELAVNGMIAGLVHCSACNIWSSCAVAQLVEALRYEGSIPDGVTAIFQ